MRLSQDRTRTNGSSLPAASPAFFTALLVSITSFIGCSDRQAGTADLERRSITDSVGAEQIGASVLYENVDLGFPWRPSVAGDYLIVLNPYAPPFVHMIDLTTASLVRAFGRAGEGPGEYKFPFSVAASETGTTIWVGDPNQGRITELSLSDTATSRDLVSRIIPLPAIFRQVLRVGDSGFLVGDASGNSRFFLLNDLGEMIARVGTPPRVSPDVPVSVAAQAYLDVLASHPDTTLVAAAGIRTGSLVFYSFDGVVVDSADVPYELTPSFSVGRSGSEPSMIPDPNAPYAYVDIATTDEYVLAVYSGRTLEEYGSEASEGKELHLFNWEGDLIDTFRLSTAVNSIAIDPSSGIVYGTQWGELPGVVQFVVPQLRS